METIHQHSDHAKDSNHYPKLLLMAVLSFIAMYFLMYSMVDSFSNVISNINQFYMAALMTAPMLILEMLLMRSMYKNKRLNTLIVLISSLVLILCFLFIRKQTAVSDKQFLKSMIPHHAAAILMVEQTELTDPEIQKLANDIISAQQKEIEFMKSKLKEMNGK
jgi:uncharacterized protein (DUF305 family)